MGMNKRIEWIDFAKGIGILSVVISHTALLPFDVSGVFHMPLFAVLSGFLYHERNAETCKSCANWIMKKVEGIYWPFVKYNIIFLLLHNLFVRANILSTVHGGFLLSIGEIVQKACLIVIMGAGESLVGPFWYLIAMLEFTIIYNMLVFVWGRLCKNTAMKWWCVTASCIVLALLGFSSLALPRNLNSACILLLYYHLGYIIKRVGALTRFHLEDKRAVAVCLVSFVCGGIVLVFAYFGYGWGKAPSSVIGSLAGIALVFVLSIKAQKYVNTNWYKFFQYAGKNSIYILALHLLCFKIVAFIQIRCFGLEPILLGSYPIVPTNSIIWNLAYVTVGMVVPLLYVHGKQSLNHVYRSLQMKE